MKKTKVIIGLLIIVMVLLILMPSSKAALQSNGGTSTTQKLEDWITNIRKMESIGGALGLTETINSDLTSSSGSNNLDIHMQKNTEYGAIAILSASSYGNPNKIASGETTTGNETGIVININKEWVAAQAVNPPDYIVNVNSKYKNVYVDKLSDKVGDAMLETKGWHSGSSDWNQRWSYNGLIRAYSGSIFSYYSNGGSASTPSYKEKLYASRAIMICGEGI